MTRAMRTLLMVLLAFGAVAAPTATAEEEPAQDAATGGLPLPPELGDGRCRPGCVDGGT